MKTRYRIPALSIIPVLLMGFISACGIGLNQSQEQATAVNPMVHRDDTGDDPAPVEIESEPPQTFLPSPTTTPPAGFDKWALWIDGPHLRGADIYQRRVYPELDGPEFMGSGYVGPPYTQEDFSRLAALGANYVNISHPGLFTEDPPYSLDQNMQNNLDNLINMIAQADMFAVISFRTGPGRSEFTFFYGEDGDWFDSSYYNDAVWQDQSAQDAWAAMWKYTAQRYKDNPMVAGYDLMVEPNANEVWHDEWDPEIFYGDYANTLSDWNQLFPRITTAIRQVDVATPLLVGGMAYSNVGWLPYLRPSGDPRTVYTFHQYDPHLYTHQFRDEIEHSYPGTFDTDWDGVDDQFNRTWLDHLLALVGTFVSAHGGPMAANEFGVMRWVPGAAEFMDDQIDLFEQRGLNHALWVWDPAWQPLTEEENAFNFRFGPDPQNVSDVDNELINVIVKYWRRNNIRPSSTLDSTSFLPIVAGAGDSVTGTIPLADVSYWAYQIQDINEPGTVEALETSHYDMLVLEPTRTDWSSNNKNFDTQGMVTRLKNSKGSDNVHKKLVIAYMDIGEAEDWRWYWTWPQGWDCTSPRPSDWPDFILTCDPDGWTGNYPVAYWDSRWKDIIIYGKNQNSAPYGDYSSAIDEAIKDGFDGIYLDWVEAYENPDVIAAAQAAGKNPALEMIKFIQEMRDYATARHPGFLIIQQNAAALSEGHPELFNVIDAIAQEAIWYDGDATDDWDDPGGYDWENDSSLVDYTIIYLHGYKDAGLPVFNCEYALNLANTAYINSYAKGYIPYVTRPSLSRLSSTPPPDYR